MQKKIDPIRIDIEKLIASKSEKLAKRMPKFLMNYLKKTLHQDDINELLTKFSDLKGIDFVDNALKHMNITYKAHNIESLDETKNYIFVSNHPLGGLDGLIAMSALGEKFPNMKVIVNDFLMHIEPIKDLFVPVNKLGTMSREYADILDKTYSSSSPIYNFPAGLCSRLIKGEITDLEWKKTFVGQAKKHGRDIVPIFFSGKNSNFFYNLSKFRTKFGVKFNIEMLYLPDEMFKQRGNHFDLYIGKPISHQNLNKHSVKEWTSIIKKESYKLKK